MQVSDETFNEKHYAYYYDVDISEAINAVRGPFTSADEA